MLTAGDVEFWLILKRPRNVELAVQQELRLDAKLAVIAQLSDVVIAAFPKLKQALARPPRGAQAPAWPSEVERFIVHLMST